MRRIKGFAPLLMLGPVLEGACFAFMVWQRAWLTAVFTGVFFVLFTAWLFVERRLYVLRQAYLALEEKKWAAMKVAMMKEASTKYVMIPPNLSGFGRSKIEGGDREYLDALKRVYGNHKKEEV